jgi:hypothetical protein
MPFDLPFDLDPTLVAIIGAVILALLAGLTVWLISRRRDRRPAIEQRTTSSRAVRLVNLDEDTRSRLEARWNDLQRDFVDTPDGALERAEVLIVEAMRKRGYPAAESDAIESLVAEHLPGHVLTFRQLRRIVHGGDRSVPTEDKRKLLLSARTLFDRLVRDEEGRDQDLMAA